MKHSENKILSKCFQETNIRIALCLVIILLFFCQFFSENYQRKLDLQRKFTYGFHNGCAFDISEESANQLASHRAVSSSGTMFICGQIIDSKGQQLGAIGEVDEAFQQLEQLEFLEGRYPVAEGEIAVENALLDQLNIPYALGESISFQIAIDENTIVSRTYCLTGILKTYTTNWKNEGFSLCTAFVGSSSESILQQHVFFVAEYKEAAQMDELQQLIYGTSNSCLAYNTYSYPDEQWSLTGMIADGLLTIIASIISMLFLIAIHISSYRKQLYRIRVLVSLGADKRKLIHLLYGQAFSSWAGTFFIVALSCSIICIVLKSFEGTEFQSQISILPYILSGTASLLVILIAKTVQIALLDKVSILPKGRDLTRFEPTLSYHGLRREVSCLNDFCSIQHKRNRRHFLLEAGLSLMAITSLFICMYGISKSYRDYRAELNIVGYDYAWMSSDTSDGLFASDIIKIQNTSNIDKVVYASCTTSYGDSRICLQYDNCSQDEYRFMHNTRQNYENDSAVCIELVAVPEESALWDYYIMRYSTDHESFRRGDSVIVFLPELQEVSKSFYTPVNTFDLNPSTKSLPAYRSQLEPGDTVAVIIGDKEVKLTCDNMIYRFPSHSQTTMDFLTPGSILVSEALYCSLLSMDEIRYNYVFAVGNNNLSYDIGDKLMSYIASGRGVSFTNNRIQTETLRNSFLADVSALSIIAILTCVLTLLILYRNKTYLYAVENARISLLTSMGCPRKIIAKMYSSKLEPWVLPFAILLNGISVLTIAYRNYSLFVPAGGLLARWKMICSYAFNYFPWIILIVPQLGFLFLLICLSGTVIYKNVVKKE